MRLAIPISILTSILNAATFTRPAVPALALYNRGEYTEAVSRLIQVPPSASHLKLLGQCYFMLGEFRKATDTLERSATLDPNDSMTVTWLGRAWGRRAENSFPLNALVYAGKARDAFEHAVQMDPRNAEALGDLFDFYLDAPSMLGGGTDKAEGLLPAYARYDPLGGYIARARIEERKQRYQDAEASLRKAVETAPRHLSIVLDLARFLSRRGRYEESERIFDEATAIAPDSPGILYAKADSYVKSNRNAEQARALLKKFLSTNNLTPDDPSRWDAEKLLRKVEGN